MRRYCDAIDACESIPMISLLPGLKSYFQFYGWIICTEICFFLALIDVPLMLMRAIFGRPRFIVGRILYAFSARPLISVWRGEIPAFKIVRVRYLTRMLLFYHAETRITDLHNAFNRRQLEILIEKEKPERPDAIAEVEAFQKTFDLFQKIINNTYQLRVLAIGGPLVALLAVLMNNAVFPLVTYLSGKVWQAWTGGPDFNMSTEFLGSVLTYVVAFVICLLWVVVSAWMEMRVILSKLNASEFERGAGASVGLTWRSEMPIDLIIYLLISAAAILFIISAYDNIDSGNQLLVEYKWTMLLTYGIAIVGLVCIGLIALGRRIWLKRRMVVVDV